MKENHIAIILTLTLCAAFTCLSLTISIAADAERAVDAIAVWSHDSGEISQFDIYYSIYDSTTDSWWSLGPGSADAIVNLDGDDLWPAVSFDQNGSAMVVWSHDTGKETGFDIYYSRWINGAWTTPSPVATLVGEDMDPAVALWWDGTGTTIWVHEGELWYSTWTGKSWDVAKPIISPWPMNLSIWLKMPEIAYDMHKNALAVWTDVPGRVYYSVLFNTTGNWNFPAEIPGQPDGAAFQSRKGISADRLGNAIAVWNSELFPPVWDNQFSTWNGTSFNSAAPIYNGSRGLGSAIAFDQLNNAMAVHGTSLTFGSIWYNELVGGTWQPTSTVTSADLQGIEPRLAFLTNGKGIAVWHGASPTGDIDIIYGIWDPRTKTWTVAPIIAGGLSGTDLGPVAIASSCGSPTTPRKIEYHDVAVIEVIPCKKAVVQNSTVLINATIENQGRLTESFQVTAYANETEIQTLFVGNLLPASRRRLSFVWDTIGYEKGNYIIRVYATPVPDETDIADNTYIYISISITITGDINGDFKVDYRDLFRLAAAYGSKSGEQRFICESDFNDDGKIDYRDLFQLAANYGKRT